MYPTDPHPDSQNAPPPEGPPWPGALFAAGAALLVYLNSLGNGFALDDVVIIAENPRLHGLSSAWELLVMPYWPGPDALDRGLYRPFTSLAFAVQWALGGGSPLPFHLLNVVLHGVVSGLLYVLLRTFIGWRGAVAGATVYAVHPVHVEAVANGVGQAELWSGVLVLAAAVVYVRRGRDGLTLARGGAVAGLYGLAMLFKEHAVVLPALLLLLDLGGGRLRRPTVRRQWVPFGVLLGGVAAQYLALRWIVLGGSLSGSAAMDLPFLLDPGTRVLTALSVWPEYARLLAFPLDLSAAYDPATLVARESMGGAVALGLLILGGGFAAALLPRTRRAWGVGFLWFFLTILPVSNLLLPVGTLLGERTLYLPSMALGFWVGFAVESVRGLGSVAVRRGLAAALVVLLAALSWRTVDRNPVWRDNPSLFEVTLREHPENFRAHWFHALETAAAGDLSASADAWRQAEQIYDSNSGFLTQYAAFQRNRGRTAEAVELLDRSLGLRPGSAQAVLIRGLLDLDLGDPSAAHRRVTDLTAMGFPGIAHQLADSIAIRSPSGAEDFP